MNHPPHPPLACGASFRWLLLAFILLLAGIPEVAGAPPADRFVWIFGWNLRRDGDVEEIFRILETAARHGLNGAVVSFGLDTLCKKDEGYFRRLNEIRGACERNRLELIPAIFSVGYGGAALSHDRNLAEGLPVEGALFRVKDGQARLAPDESIRIENGGFEEFSGHRLKNYRFHDQPGEVSFVDEEIAHSGGSSLRMENFTANPHGHGRVMQEIRVKPRRSYRIQIWVKTEELKPAGAFRVQVLAGDRALAPRQFQISPTADWQKITMVFNSLGFESVRLYAGVWGGRAGRFWLDDWTIEEVGPLNVLHRPGTPVTVRSDDGSITYVEGADYAPLEDPRYRPWDLDRDAPPLKILAGGRIREGQELRVSWYHPMVIHSSQITVCMAEPKLYEIYDHEAELLAERLKPRRVLLNMDEIRMGGTCAACRGRDMGQLLGECITKQVKILRRYLPEVQISIWSDMLDPNHNAHGDYYLVEGDFTGSWKHIPRDLTMAVWGGRPREASLRFFADEGFPVLIACYYDAPNLEDVKNWLQLSRGMKNVTGFMYTPWRKSYDLLGEFGELLKGER